MREPQRVGTGRRLRASALWSAVPVRSRSRRLARDVLRRRLLAVADMAAALAATATLLRFGGGVDQAFWAAVFLPAWIVLAKVHGLYDRDHRALRHLTVDEVASIAFWALTGTGVVALALLATPSSSLTATTAAVMAATAAGAGAAARAAARLVWRRTTQPEETLVVGEGPLAEATRRKFELFRDIHARVVHQRPTLALDELYAVLARTRVDRIVVASSAIDEHSIAQLVAFCRRQRVKLSVVPPVRGMFGTAVQLTHVGDLPVVDYNTWDVSRSTLALKRVLDVAVAAPALVLLSPLLGAVAIAVRLDSRGPALFSQVRAGLHGRPFRMLKFRTMVWDAEARLGEVVRLDELAEPVFKLRRDPRVTRVGRVLRRTSLDELPQLWNVLRGDMSLVGPRPEQLDLVERYTDEQRIRLAVKPGITGPMQVQGRGELSLSERLAVEREYIENLSLGRDLRLLALTVATVVTGRGAY